MQNNYYFAKNYSFPSIILTCTKEYVPIAKHLCIISRGACLMCLFSVNKLNAGGMNSSTNLIYSCKFNAILAKCAIKNVHYFVPLHGHH